VRGIAVGDPVVAMADLNGDGGWVAGGECGYALAREFLTVPQAGIPEPPTRCISADVLPLSLCGAQRNGVAHIQQFPWRESRSENSAY
jgi:hypothetical protein